MGKKQNYYLLQIFPKTVRDKQRMDVFKLYISLYKKNCATETSPPLDTL